VQEEHCREERDHEPNDAAADYHCAPKRGAGIALLHLDALF
jgi:hypothetical protein